MNGYEVITFDDEKVGEVVGRRGGILIVEHDSIFKHTRPLPESFATIDDDARLVRATVSKNVFESAPELHDGVVDEQAVAEHYGLSSSFDADLPLTAELTEVDSGLVPASEARAALREHLGPGEGPDDAGLPSPGITGRDRRRDAGA